MSTYIMSKRFFLEQLKEIIDEGEDRIILSDSLQGRMGGASKKRLKSFEIGFADDCFKDPATIKDILHSKCFGLIIINKKNVPEETLTRVSLSEKKYEEGE